MVVQEKLPVGRRYSPGSVWRIQEPMTMSEIGVKCTPHVAVGNRPYMLIGRPGRMSARGNIYWGCPVIQDKEAGRYGISINDSVGFIDPTSSEGKHYVVCVDQIRTLDVDILHSYLYTLPDEALSAVTESIAYRLGLFGNDQKPWILSIFDRHRELIGDGAVDVARERFTEAMVNAIVILGREPKYPSRKKDSNKIEWTDEVDADIKCLSKRMKTKDIAAVLGVSNATIIRRIDYLDSLRPEEVIDYGS